MMPIRGEALQQVIQEHIKRYIIDHQLTHGAAMPTELELARELGVSRNAIREAMKVLQTLGIVETRHGYGTFVGPFTLNALVEGLTFRILSNNRQDLHMVREILEVRQIIETSLVSRLSGKMTPSSLSELDALVTGMEVRARKGEISPEEDRAFHNVLYSTLGNSLVLQLLQAFWDVFNVVRSTLPGTPSDPTVTAIAHRRILDAVLSGDSIAASQAMIAHFEGIQGWIDEPSALDIS
jgi:DNA-binding FadR family transcriptional regulator